MAATRSPRLKRLFGNPSFGHVTACCASRYYWLKRAFWGWPPRVNGGVGIDAGASGQGRLGRLHGASRDDMRAASATAFLFTGAGGLAPCAVLAWRRPRWRRIGVR